MEEYHYRRPGVWSFALVVIPMLVLAPGSWSLAFGAGSGDGPHAQCFACHRTTGPDAAGFYGFPSGIEPSLVCLDCHRYERDHHPVNFVPESSYLVSAPRSGLPLFDGELRCLTCHEVHGREPGSPSTSPNLLRGGPFGDRREICFRCHYQERYAEFNPHDMIDDEGRVRYMDGCRACNFCHDGVPDPLEHNTEMSFRADVAFLCWRCHAPMKGEFLDRHFHVTPSREVRVGMGMLLRNENIRLPLGVDGMVTCSTCHNPHEKGALMEGPVSTGADEKDRLRLAQRKLCSACHRTK